MLRVPQRVSRRRPVLWVAPIVAPGQPTGLTAGTATSSAQPLTWTAPATGGAPTDYDVQFAAAGSGSWTTFTDGSSTTTAATVSGLSPSTSYDYRVRAVNAAGAGPWSSTVTASTAADTTYGAPADAGQTNEGDSTTGNRYWFNDTTGSDANTGLVQANPAKTLTKLLDYTTVGGSLTAPRDSHFLAARAEDWLGTIQWNQNDGTAYANFLLGASGSGSRPKFMHDNAVVPSIQGSTVWTNRDGARFKNIEVDTQETFAATVTTTGAAWTVGDTVIGITSGAQGTIKYINGTSMEIARNPGASGMAIFQNENVRNGDSTKTGALSAIIGRGAIWVLNTSNWTIENCTLRGATGNGITSGGSTNAVIRGNHIENCCRQQSNGAGIDGGSTTSTGKLVENNTVINCGAKTTTSHNMYLDREVSGVIQYNYTDYTAFWGNHSLVVHGTCTDLDIRYNWFRRGDNGIGVNSGYGTLAAPIVEIFTRIRIRANKISEHGTLSGQTQGAAMLLSGLVDSDATNNVCWENDSYGIACYEGDETGAGSVYVNDSKFNNFKSQHNCVVSTSSAFSGASGMTSARSGATSTGLVFQNEIYYGKSGASTHILFTKASNLPNSAITLRNCCFWVPGQPSAKVIQWDGVNYSVAEFATYVAANPGLGINFSGCIQQDPKLVFSGIEPIGIAADSPCKLAGYNSGVATDFNGNARHATTPSIGPWE